MRWRRDAAPAPRSSWIGWESYVVEELFDLVTTALPGG